MQAARARGCSVTLPAPKKMRADLAACNILEISSKPTTGAWLCELPTRPLLLLRNIGGQPGRAMARMRAVVLCALAAPAHGIWPFGRRTTALAKKVRSLERDTLEFESNERILLEQLRQMRLTTGELRTTLRDSIAESERVAAENAAAVAKLEGEVATLKTKLAAAEQRAAAAEASAAKAVDMESALAAAKAEAARLKKELAKTKAELKTARAPRPAARTKAKVSDGPSAAKKTASSAAAAPARRPTPQR